MSAPSVGMPGRHRLTLAGKIHSQDPEAELLSCEMDRDRTK